MEPTSPTDDFRLSIDWGEADDDAEGFLTAASAPPPPPPPPTVFATEEDDAAVSYEDDVPAATWAPDPQLPPVDATLESVAAQVQSSAVRIELLHSEAAKLRAATDRRLADVATQVGAVVDAVSDLRVALVAVSDAAGRMERLEEAVARLTERFDEGIATLADAQAGAETRLAEAADRMERGQGEVETRVGDLVGETAQALREQLAASDEQVRAALQAEFELLVSRLRSAVDQAELGLRDTYDAGRREAALAREEARTLLADVANELRLVKRRLALRAKPPVAELSDEQLGQLVRTLQAAVAERDEDEPAPLPAVIEATSSPVPDAPVRRRRRGTG